MDIEMKKNVKDSKRTDKILFAAGSLFLIVFVVSGAALLRYYLDYREQKQSNDGIAALREAGSVPEAAGADKEGEEIGQDGADAGSGRAAKESAERLRAVNADYIGWITVPDTDIYYPFVQRDNIYYLNHDFYEKKSSHGTIFLDENCAPEDGVILIHGHHMKDGTMFGALKGFRKKEFRESHETLYLDWGTGDEAYRIFAVALIDLTQETYFHYDELPGTGEERESYLKELKRNSLWYEEPGQSPGEAGQIVLLSTCEYGTEAQRLIVAAVSETIE